MRWGLVGISLGFLFGCVETRMLACNPITGSNGAIQEMLLYPPLNLHHGEVSSFRAELTRSGRNEPLGSDGSEQAPIIIYLC